MKRFYKHILVAGLAGLSNHVLAAPIKIGVEQSNKLLLSRFFSNLVHCSLSQKMKSTVAVKSPKPSKIWDLELKDISFQNGAELTEEEVKYSLTQATPIQRALLFNLSYRKNSLGVTFRFPVSSPDPFLRWHIIAAKPSLHCGNWNVVKDGLKPIALESEGQRINWTADSKDIQLERLRKGEIDLFIPETWSQIESFLRRNPNIDTIPSKNPKNLYLYLNPKKLPNLAQRLALFETLQTLALPFPFSKQDAQKTLKKTPFAKIDSNFTVGVPVDAQWLLATKAATASLLSLVKKPTIKVLDAESLYSEIKSGKLDAWVNDEELGPFTYHSQVGIDLYGQNGFTLPTLDLLIERAHTSEGGPALQEIKEVLKQNGIMLKIATINVAGLISKKTLEAESKQTNIAEVVENLME